MTPYISILRSIIDSRSLRERIMILITAVVTPLVILDAIFLADHNNNYEELVKEITHIQKQTLDLRIAEKNILISHAKDLNKDVDVQVGELGSQLEELNKRLQSVTTHLIPAGRLTDTVKEFLAMPGGALLTRVISHPARPSFQTVEGSSSNTDLQANIYIHNLDIEFQGSYQEILDYLKRLESMPWHIQWERIAINGNTYPTVKVALTIGFLSLEKELIGI